MTEGSFTLSSAWTKAYRIVLMSLLAIALLSAWRSGNYEFREVTWKSIASLLMPMFVIAVFLERAQEVFVAAWRGLKRFELDHELKETRQRLAKAKQCGDPPGDIETLEQQVMIAKRNVETYKAKTAIMAFVVGMAGGVLIAAVGVRCLESLIVEGAVPGGAGGVFFKTVDIFLTGGLIGGGSEGLHHVMSYLLNVTKTLNADATNKLEEQKNKADAS